MNGEEFAEELYREHLYFLYEDKCNELSKELENPKKIEKEHQRINGKLKEENKQLKNQLQQKENIIKEVREYITSYESIETIQQFDHNKNNKDLDYSTIDEMTRRYMIVHDKLLEIIDRS